MFFSKNFYGLVITTLFTNSCNCVGYWVFTMNQSDIVLIFIDMYSIRKGVWNCKLVFYKLQYFLAYNMGDSIVCDINYCA